MRRALGLLGGKKKTPKNLARQEAKTVSAKGSQRSDESKKNAMHLLRSIEAKNTLGKQERRGRPSQDDIQNAKGPKKTLALILLKKQQ